VTKLKTKDLSKINKKNMYMKTAFH